MQYFWDWAVMPLLLSRKEYRILEVGASLGHNTEKILASLPLSRVTVVDPCFDYDLVHKFKDNERVRVVKGKSLEVFPGLSETYDAILLDGDHNFYTVFNELRYIEEKGLLAHEGIVLLHDIGPPYGRKDLFYDPEAMPAEAKVPEERQGVLTGVEEFMKCSNANWTLLKWSAEHGLGCLFKKNGFIPLISLRSKICFWHGIRWKNRVLRLLGLKSPDLGRWGKAK
ncbi:MAG: class I SAM-dependent methyltransferase [Desulfobulbus sp.]